RDADDRRFRDWRVDDAVAAELLDEAIGHAEHTAADADVLPKQDVALVAPELREQRVVDRLHVRLLGHASSPNSGGNVSGSRSRDSGYAAVTMSWRLGFVK